MGLHFSGLLGLETSLVVDAKLLLFPRLVLLLTLVLEGEPGTELNCSNSTNKLVLGTQGCSGCDSPNSSSTPAMLVLLLGLHVAAAGIG